MSHTAIKALRMTSTESFMVRIIRPTQQVGANPPPLAANPRPTTQTVILSLRRIRWLPYSVWVVFRLAGRSTPTLSAHSLILRCAQNDKGWRVLVPARRDLSEATTQAVILSDRLGSTTQTVILSLRRIRSLMHSVRVVIGFGLAV